MKEGVPMDKIQLDLLDAGEIVSDDVGHLFMRVTDRTSDDGALVNFVCQCGEEWTSAGVIEEVGGSDALKRCKVTCE